jgi:hypothetical protein
VDHQLDAAIQIMGAALAGVSLRHPEMGADFEVDEGLGLLTARIVTPSGDVYEISTRWVKEASP